VDYIAESTEAAIAEGYSIVIGLQSTGMHIFTLYYTLFTIKCTVLPTSVSTLKQLVDCVTSVLPLA
jgi:hypothetical protein